MGGVEQRMNRARGQANPIGQQVHDLGLQDGPHGNALTLDQHGNITTIDLAAYESLSRKTRFFKCAVSPSTRELRHQAKVARNPEFINMVVSQTNVWKARQDIHDNNFNARNAILYNLNVAALRTHIPAKLLNGSFALSGAINNGVQEALDGLVHHPIRPAGGQPLDLTAFFLQHVTRLPLLGQEPRTRDSLARILAVEVPGNLHGSLNATLGRVAGDPEVAALLAGGLELAELNAILIGDVEPREPADNPVGLAQTMARGLATTLLAELVADIQAALDGGVPPEEVANAYMALLTATNRGNSDHARAFAGRERPDFGPLPRPPLPQQPAPPLPRDRQPPPPPPPGRVDGGGTG